MIGEALQVRGPVPAVTRALLWFLPFSLTPFFMCLCDLSPGCLSWSHFIAFTQAYSIVRTKVIDGRSGGQTRQLLPIFGVRGILPKRRAFLTTNICTVFIEVAKVSHFMHACTILHLNFQKNHVSIIDHSLLCLLSIAKIFHWGFVIRPAALS